MFSEENTASIADNVQSLLHLGEGGSTFLQKYVSSYQSTLRHLAGDTKPQSYRCEPQMSKHH